MSGPGGRYSVEVMVKTARAEVEANGRQYVPAIELAIEHMKAARDLLTAAGAKNAGDAARRALKSTDGAWRNAVRQAEVGRGAAEKEAGE